MPQRSDESEFDYARRRAQVQNRGGFLDDEVMPAVSKLLDKISELKRDRDEWEEQHENLLAIYRAQTAELAALRAAQQQLDKLDKGE